MHANTRAEPQTKALIIQALTKEFAFGAMRVPVLHAIDISIQRGEFIGIVGKNRS